MPNLKQVAEIANVSTATASRVLGNPRHKLPVSPDTSRRVQEAAAQLGYRVNYHMHAVATGRANVTGFAPEVRLDAEAGLGIGDHYFDALRRGVEYTTQEAGMALMSIHPGKGMTALQRGQHYLQERRLDVLVVPGSQVVRENAHEFEANPELPLVVVNPLSPVRRPQVRFDTHAGMKLIVEHLRSLGHREVLWVGPATGASGGPSVRQQMFVDVAWQSGLLGSAALIECDPLCPAPRQQIKHARRAIAERLGEPKRSWTAVVAYNDLWAVAAVAAVRDAGLRVPADISIVGFDNLISEYCVPELTTVDHRFYEMGRRAGALAARMVDASASERVAMSDYAETVEPRLIIGESTCAPPER